MTLECDEITEALIARAYWPWPLALAFCQAKDRRKAALEAAAEVLTLYPADKNLSGFTASSAVARIYEATSGKCYMPDAETATGSDGGIITIKTAEKVYWSEVAELERPLLAALELGSLEAMGRPSPDASLEIVPSSDWVGGEVDPVATSDLVKAGWRESDILGKALDEAVRVARFYDIHLKGAAVRQFANALDQQRSAEETDALMGGDYSRFETLEIDSDLPREGYWSPLVAGSWIGSRSDPFVAAAQKYEKDMLCERGGVYSCSAWLVVGNLMGKRYGISLTQSLNLLREALESGRVEGGKARTPMGAPRLIERFEWTQWEDTAHNSSGVSLLPGLIDFAWPSDKVRGAFPAHPTSPPAALSRPTYTDKDVLKRCDDLWLSGMSVRELTTTIYQGSDFPGATVDYLRMITTGRYPRLGKGGIAARKRHIESLKQ